MESYSIPWMRSAWNVRLASRQSSALTLFMYAYSVNSLDYQSSRTYSPTSTNLGMSAGYACHRHNIVEQQCYRVTVDLLLVCVDE